MKKVKPYYCPHCEARMAQLSDNSWLCPKCDYWDIPIVHPTPTDFPLIDDSFLEVFNA